jgi:NAD(P)-dependent dehydrogenase (short-subunit alcohol dehydrogenase family)
MSSPGRILITGANRGIGLGLAREFAHRGWMVFAGCRRPGSAAELALLRRENAEVEVVALDVSDETGIASALSRIGQWTDRLDVLVNNAGINPEPREVGVAEVPVTNVAEALDVNVLGALRVLQASLPLLRRSERPRIVNISSGAGSLAHNTATPARPQPAYCVSKAALNLLTRAAARDLPGIIVVSVSPGWVRTDMGGPGADLRVEEAARALASTIVELKPSCTGQWLDRFGRPSEYAW